MSSLAFLLVSLRFTFPLKLSLNTKKCVNIKKISYFESLTGHVSYNQTVFEGTIPDLNVHKTMFLDGPTDKKSPLKSDPAITISAAAAG